MNKQRSFWQQPRSPVKSYIASVLTLLLVLVSLGPFPGTRPVGAAPHVANPIQHIVIMVKENRSFDSMFGTFPGADGATTYVDPNGQVHPLNHQPDRLSFDIAHDYPAFKTAYDNGKMDGFSLISGAIQYINGVPTDVADSQFQQSDIPNYWKYAQTFALPDHFYYTVRGPSFPDHLFTIAATDDDVYTNPQGVGIYITRWGCDDPKGTTVKELHADGSITSAFPCFTFPTLGDLLTTHGVSWKYYAPGQDKPGYEWSSYNAIKDIRLTSQWQTHVVDYRQFAKDAASGSLPTVSWLVQPHTYSDHPGVSMCVGENWTVKQINAIMGNASLWKSTAIFLTWDDFGGYYDHVKPSTGPDGYIEYGFRAPILVISPYAKPHYVDSTTYTLSSILKFAETVLGLPSLGGLDTQANDMFNAFNFSQNPLPPLILQQRTCPTGSLKEAPFLDQS